MKNLNLKIQSKQDQLLSNQVHAVVMAIIVIILITINI